MKQSHDAFEDDFEDNLDEFSSEEDYEAQGAYGDKDDYGLCPLCGGPGETVSVGVRQWVVCHRDRVKWRLGLGFFALFQRRETWDQTPREVASYREVQPLREPKEETETRKNQVPDDEEARFRRMMGE